MVGFLVAVAQRKVTPEDLKWLLQNPGESNWQKFADDVELAPPGGLYLLNIGYNESG